MPGKSRAQQALEAEDIKPLAQRLGINPAKYHKALDRRAADYALLGASNEEIALLLGVDQSAFAVWAIEKPSLRAALARSREAATVRVVKSLHRLANGYDIKRTKVRKGRGGQVLETTEETRHVPPSERAAMAILTNRAPRWWRDAKQVEHVGRVDLLAMVQASLEPGTPLPAADPLTLEAEAVDVAPSHRLAGA